MIYVYHDASPISRQGLGWYLHRRSTSSAMSIAMSVSSPSLAIASSVFDRPCSALRTQFQQRQHFPTSPRCMESSVGAISAQSRCSFVNWKIPSPGE